MLVNSGALVPSSINTTTFVARLQIALADRRPVVAWTVTNAVLQQARETGGLWRDIVPVPASPYTIETGEANFYRLRSR